jgi:uncharacterized membrane protein
MYSTVLSRIILLQCIREHTTRNSLLAAFCILLTTNYLLVRRTPSESRNAAGQTGTLQIYLLLSILATGLAFS